MPEKKKTLYRLPKQGKIFGVCAGLADFFDMDVTLVRVIFVIMAFATGGTAVLLYILLAIVLPVPGESNTTLDKKLERVGKDIKENDSIFWGRNYFGVGLIILGIWLFLCQLYPMLFSFRWDYIWPVILIIVGILIIIRRSHGR
jgi:phage shock protein PspC (stress-responsive transcriptional regulator)